MYSHNVMNWPGFTYEKTCYRNQNQRALDDIRELCRRDARAAVERLCTLGGLRMPEKPPATSEAVQVVALRENLARAYGHAPIADDDAEDQTVE